MRIKHLLLLPLLLGLVACSTPPEITATSRKDAFAKCFADIDETMAEMRANPSMNVLRDSKYETRTKLKTYCKPMKDKQHEGYWTVLGYLEFLVEPTDAAFTAESKVDRVILSYGYNWKE